MDAPAVTRRASRLVEPVDRDRPLRAGVAGRRDRTTRALGFSRSLACRHSAVVAAAADELTAGHVMRKRLVSRWSLAFALVAVGGIVLRIWIYRSALGTPNSDEAVPGLMTLHAL